MTKIKIKIKILLSCRFVTLFSGGHGNTTPIHQDMFKCEVNHFCSRTQQRTIMLLRAREQEWISEKFWGNLRKYVHSPYNGLTFRPNN